MSALSIARGSLLVSCVACVLSVVLVRLRADWIVACAQIALVAGIAVFLSSLACVGLQLRDVMKRSAR